MTEPTAVPEVKITPDRYLTYRYAGASGDFNPIHLDDEFARGVGLPGRIVHGLWTMAQVARAATQAQGGRGGPESLKSLEVTFRGMGVPEKEMTITGTAHEPREGITTIDFTVDQDGSTIIRRATAEIAI